MPKVTVLLPVFNAARYLASAVESVLNQTYGDFELLVMDDGSTDGSRDVVRGYDDSRIRLVENGENIGLTRTLNRGLELSRGSLIARQDADDIAHPRRLEMQVDRLDRDGETVLVGSWASVVNEADALQGLLTHPTSPLGIRWCMLFENAFVHSSVVFRREILLHELGGYDVSFAECEDFALWSSVANRYPVANLPLPLVRYRRYEASKSRRESLSDRWVRENLRVIARNGAYALGEGWPLTGQVDLLLHLQTGVSPHVLVPLVDLLESMREQYLGLNPVAGTSSDFWRVVARQYLRLGRGLMPSSSFSELPRTARNWLRTLRSVRQPIPLARGLLLEARLRAGLHGRQHEIGSCARSSSA